MSTKINLNIEDLKEIAKKDYGPDSFYISLNSIENLMVEKFINIVFIEENIKEILPILSDYLHYYGLNCYDSIVDRNGHMCKMSGFICEDCPFKFSTLKDFFKGVLLFQNYRNGRIKISHMLSGYINKFMYREVSELLLEMEKTNNQGFLYEIALIKNVKFRDWATPNLYNLITLKTDDTKLYAVLYAVYKRSKRGGNYFNYFESNQFESELEKICNLFFKSV